LNLIKEGAKKIELSEDYIKKLEKIQPINANIVKKIIFLVLNLPLILLMLLIIFIPVLLGFLGFIKLRGLFVTTTFLTLGKILWFEHDYFLKFILGNGRNNN
jgi:hypothetical protein